MFWDAVQKAGVKDRLILAPGNHDVCCLGLRMPASRRDRWQKDMARLSADLAMGGLRVRFAGLLYQYREVPVKIVALHHSPNIPEVETSVRRGGKAVSRPDRLTLQIPQDQRQTLRLLCVSHRVRLVVHGHVHLAEQRRVNGISIVGAPASTEPVKVNGGGVCRVWEHAIGGKAGRVRRRLVSVAV